MSSELNTVYEQMVHMAERVRSWSEYDVHREMGRERRKGGGDGDEGDRKRSDVKGFAPRTCAIIFSQKFYMINLLNDIDTL